jgi:hypothetical protein
MIAFGVVGTELPPMPEDPRTVAMHSFAQFGRQGFAATYEDTIPFGSGGKRRT